MTQTLLPDLDAALGRSADPDGARPLALGILEAAASHGEARLRELASRSPQSLLRALACICGAAPFLARFLQHHPELFLRLLEDDLARQRAAEEYGVRLDAAYHQGTPGQEPIALRLFKYGELARLSVRELSPDLVLPEHEGEVLAELSHLADALLSRALTTARARADEALGQARWTTAEGEVYEPRFSVLGLGKLGGEELNYSSDVDLIYVYEAPATPSSLPSAPAPGPRPLAPSPPEYFTRLAQELGRLVTENTAEGFLYRIDLDLRPEGAAGPLVISHLDLANYYDLWAQTWEKASFMKARPVAGDLDFGWAAIRAIDPMIYRSSMDFAAVNAIRELKDKIEKAKGRSGSTFDVKLGSGGIRDVEFVAQALLLLHGGRIPQLRDRSTQGALVRLAQVGLLSEATKSDLLAAYLFLRRSENRLQMVDERQTHRLPADVAARRRLARSMGFEDATAFDAELQVHRRRVQSIFAGLFPQTASTRILALFEQSAPQALANPLTRARIEELAARFADAIDSGPSPERALNNLDRFIQGVGSRSFYYGLLLDRPELVRRLAGLFAASEYLSGYLASHPRLIEPIFSDPNVLLLSCPELERELERMRAEMEVGEAGDPIEVELDALRLFHNRELINIGLLDLSDKVTPTEANAGLTDLAEVCLARALEIARAETRRRREARGDDTGAEGSGGFLVVGMGKLASRELTYGSDLDVIFLYDSPGADEQARLEEQEHFVRLAQKLIWALQTRTREGVGYQIDARLRPSGNQGPLVTSLTAFARHHAESGAVWQRQALLRARPIVGSARLGEAFRQLRLAIISRPLVQDPRAEIHRIRLRMEKELAQETHQRHDFKTGRGGILDVESVVQYLQLAHGPSHAALLEVDPIAVHIDRLEELALLPAQDAAVLRQGWDFLNRLSSRLRIVENRSISDLDEERGDLESVAQQLGYGAGRASGARRALLDDYRRHTAAVREVYRRVFHAVAEG